MRSIGRKTRSGPQPSVCGPLQQVARVTRFPRKSEGRFGGYSGQRPLKGRAGNPEASRRFADGQAPDGFNLLDGNLPLRSSELPALRLGAGKARDHALLQACARTRQSSPGRACKPPAGRRPVEALPRDTNATPRACSSSSRMTRCFRDLRSGPAPAHDHVESDDDERRAPAGRGQDCGPSHRETPWSTNSVAVQPRPRSTAATRRSWFSTCWSEC